MIEQALAGSIDIILTKSISRFARNTVDLLSTVRALKAAGVSVRFERENIDTANAEGEVLLTLLASFAQAESESISANGASVKSTRMVCCIRATPTDTSTTTASSTLLKKKP